MKAVTENANRILSWLFHHGPAARAVLADALGIRPNTVGEVCADLIANGTLIEIDANRRRNVPLSIRPDFLHAVGVSNTQAGFQIVVMDASCSLRFETEAVLGGVSGPARCEALGDHVKRTLRRQKVPLSRVVGIGFADLAIADEGRGVALRSAHIPGWTDIPVREILKRKTGLHAWLTGFTDAAAALEMRRIAEPGWDTALCVWLNRAIGLSVFLNGEPLRGNHPVFGEIGHIVIEPGGGICRCGNRGCLETIASIGAILQRVSQGIARGAEFETSNHSITIDEVMANARRGNKLALRVLDEAGRAVGRALAIVVNLLGISNVLLTGKLIESGDALLGPIREAVRRDCVAPMNMDADVRVASAPAENVAAGAAYLAFHRYFSERALGAEYSRSFRSVIARPASRRAKQSHLRIAAQRSP